MLTMRGIGWRNGFFLGFLILTSASRTDAGSIPLSAHLDGGNEFPPNNSPGTGDAAFILDNVNGILVSAVTFQGLANPLKSAVITEGPLGLGGTVLHTLDTSSVVGATRDRSPTSGSE